MSVHPTFLSPSRQAWGEQSTTTSENSSSSRSGTATPLSERVIERRVNGSLLPLERTAQELVAKRINILEQKIHAEAEYERIERQIGDCEKKIAAVDRALDKAKTSLRDWTDKRRAASQKPTLDVAPDGASGSVSPGRSTVHANALQHEARARGKVRDIKSKKGELLKELSNLNARKIEAFAEVRRIVSLATLYENLLSESSGGTSSIVHGSSIDIDMGGTSASQSSPNSSPQSLSVDRSPVRDASGNSETEYVAEAPVLGLREAVYPTMKRYEIPDIRVQQEEAFSPPNHIVEGEQVSSPLSFRQAFVAAPPNEDRKEEDNTPPLRTIPSLAGRAFNRPDDRVGGERRRGFFARLFGC